MSKRTWTIRRKYPRASLDVQKGVDNKEEIPKGIPRCPEGMDNKEENK